MQAEPVDCPNESRIREVCGLVVANSSGSLATTTKLTNERLPRSTGRRPHRDLADLRLHLGEPEGAGKGRRRVASGACGHRVQELMPLLLRAPGAPQAFAIGPQRRESSLMDRYWHL